MYFYLFFLSIATVAFQFVHPKNFLELFKSRKNAPSFSSNFPKLSKLFVGFLLINSFQHSCAVKNFKAASYIVTQQALDDAPDRYATFIQDAMNRIAAVPWPSESDGGHGCHVEWNINGPSAQKKLSIVPGTLVGTVISNGVNIKAVIDVGKKNSVSRNS
jgi:hypothetical protein